MRRAAQVDANQPEIVEALRSVGASVEFLHTVGKGCPDLLVGHAGRNYLLEVKDGRKVPSARQLNDDQEEWHDAWRGHRCVVESVEDALRAIGVLRAAL
jgi:hypothetical protein